MFLGGYSYFAHQLYGVKAVEEQERVVAEKATTPAWLRKEETSDVLRLGVVAELRIQLENNYSFASDIEDRYYAVEKYMKPLAFFRSRMSIFEPDYVISLGNAIIGDEQDINDGSDALEFFRTQLAKIEAPLLWVLGNRELRALTRNDFQEVTNAPTAPYAVEKGDYKIIVLDTNNSKDGEPFDFVTEEYERGALTAAQYLWLEEELKTSKHVYVFMHHGAYLRSVHVAGSKKKKKSLYDAQKLRALLGQYKVAGVFTSHLKAHAYERFDGVSYYALEDLQGHGHHPGAFYELELKGSHPVVTLYYIDQKEESLKSKDFKDGVHIVSPQEDSP